MMRPTRRLMCALALAPLLLSPVHAAIPRELRNGISVGKPKVFDNRTLTLMIESLSQALQSTQSQFVDKASLAAALANIQGTRSTEINRSVSVNALPIPSVVATTTDDFSTTDGVKQPTTTTVTTTSTQAALSPTPPALDITIPPFSGFTPTFGQSASDLLSEQVNISYQIFNLRMILERSLSDRLLNDGARRQGVLGFSVTIDPPRTATDSVAVVEITLTAPACDPGDLSLVALMPQEKTYNSATLSTRSNSFGGSAIVNLFQVGFNERRRGQTFYLYRDNDTVAYERMQTGSPNTIVFGWMFRPVLGRRSVSPGLRQLFAVASLPAADTCSGTSRECPPLKLSAKVKTYWKKYDADTLTSFDSRDANRARRFLYVATLGLMRPEIFQADRYQNDVSYTDVVIESTATYEQGLGPHVDDVKWTPVGTKNALISATGRNFFTGTQVTLGDKTFVGNADGLVLKSNNAFDLLTTLDSMSAGPGAVSGRYGSAIPFVIEKPAKDKGISFSKLILGPTLSGLNRVEVFLAARDGGDLTMGDLPPSSPLISVNGTTMALPYLANDFTAKDGRKQVHLAGSISASLLSKGQSVIRVAWPFQGELWTATTTRTDPADQFEILRIGEKRLLLRTSKIGGFSTGTDNPLVPLAQGDCWKLFAGDDAFPLATETCAGDTAQSQRVGKFAVILKLSGSIPEKLILFDPEEETYHLTVPKGAPAADTGTKLSVKQFDSVWLDVPVDDASKVGSVEANGQALRAIPKKPGDDGSPGKSVKVLITRDITAKPGTVDLNIIGSDGSQIATPHLTITPCETCKETR
jgi:hypothetical protein